MLTVEKMWCNECQANKGHLREGFDMLGTLAVTLLTFGLWLIAIVYQIATSKREPWYCMCCGAEYGPPERR